jgi:hypothetical protein
MATRTIWNGSVDEAQELCDILRRNCECDEQPNGSPTRCPPHVMLLSDQRALDGLLFVRRISMQLLREEFDASAMTRGDGNGDARTSSSAGECQVFLRMLREQAALTLGEPQGKPVGDAHAA